MRTALIEMWLWQKVLTQQQCDYLSWLQQFLSHSPLFPQFPALTIRGPVMGFDLWSC